MESVGYAIYVMHKRFVFHSKTTSTEKPITLSPFPAMVTTLQDSATMLAKDVVFCLNNALKNIAFFPRGHDNIINSTTRLLEILKLFLSKYGCFHIQIDKGQLLFEEKVIQENVEDESHQQL